MPKASMQSIKEPVSAPGFEGRYAELLDSAYRPSKPGALTGSLMLCMLALGMRPSPSAHGVRRGIRMLVIGEGGGPPVDHGASVRMSASAGMRRSSTPPGRSRTPQQGAGLRVCRDMLNAPEISGAFRVRLNTERSRRDSNTE